MVRIALYLPPEGNKMWILGRQLGVDYAVAGLPTDPKTHALVWDYSSMLHMKMRYEDFGYKILSIENRPPADKIKLGLPGRDEQIDGVCEMIENMGRLGIPVWCWEFMAGDLFVVRTSYTTPTRGGALTVSYDESLLANAPLTKYGVVPEELLWDNLQYYLERIVPVAEKAGVKLAIHPDDPPRSPTRGIARLFSKPENFKRMMEMVPSPVNGITFCQGCFAEMGVDVPATIRDFGDKIFFVHFRNILGTPTNFVETFHDEGNVNMLEAMRAFRDVGFDGPMRPDHVPTMEGDANDTPSYTDRGRLFAIGYMKGLLQAVNAEK
jgi:mannonate dehydratase